ncbi:MAG: hypothetical protein MJZ89_02195 [Paludibacteraceae bacterium]|nr:hypothetical protein [Paludibacteraceae bacterium]
MGTVGKTIGCLTPIVLLIVAGWFYFQYCFVRSEGVDTGELNYFAYQGVVFKTYEGKLIQTGFQRNATGAQSNEFRFSVDNSAIADSLMHCTGKQVELHYRKYTKALPWRGESVYVVDSIWSVKNVSPSMYKSF